MNKELAKEYLDYLDRKYTEWYTHPKQRSAIQSEIYLYANRWDDEIYLHLNDGRASGLFEHGFFESDIEKAFRLLQEIVNEGQPQTGNVLYMIYCRLENFKPSQEDVVRKELRDYLLEKIHKGNLQKGKITFDDEEDLEYFTRLSEKVGFKADDLLKNIVCTIFT